MSITYPIIPAWSYPVTRVLEFETVVFPGDNGIEQRWPHTPGRESVTLSYPRLTLTERDVLLDVFDAAKGDVDQTISLTLGAETLTGLYFDSPKLPCMERTHNRWEVTVTLRQVLRVADTGALPADFPVLSTGARVQLPYNDEREFLSVTATTEGGRSAHARRAASLLRWSAGGAVLTDAEAQAIWDMFSRAGGRWKAFRFTDPDSGTRYDTCRFAADKIERRYKARGMNSIEVQIEQIP